MRKILFTRPDGGLSIITPVESEQHAWEALPKDALNPHFVSDVEIPDDRDFRDAWKDTGSGVVIVMSKAREIHKSKLRKLRTPKLAALDVEYQRADEAGDVAGKKQIAARKQALRDVTADPRIAAATTPEQLKAVIPDVLT